MKVSTCVSNYSTIQFFLIVCFKKNLSRKTCFRRQYCKCLRHSITMRDVQMYEMQMFISLLHYRRVVRIPTIICELYSRLHFSIIVQIYESFSIYKLAINVLVYRMNLSQTRRPVYIKPCVSWLRYSHTKTMFGICFLRFQLGGLIDTF